jgi:hypothetical protein
MMAELRATVGAAGAVVALRRWPLRWLMWGPLAAAAGLAVSIAAVAAAAPRPPPRPAPTFDGSAWRRMETRPGGPASQRPAPPRQGRRRCIDISNVAAAQLFGDDLIELTLKGDARHPGSRWRVHLAQNCPALSFYQGFYYRQRPDSRLCAGRDVVGARSGGECAIAAIVRMRPAAR